MPEEILIIPILLPIVCGVVMLPLHMRSDRARDILCEAAACLTSVLVWVMLIAGSREPVTVFSFAHGFSMSFRVDGMASLFAGMVSLMWPFALLYAFDYMEGSHRKNVFFAFYLATYGVTLSVAFAANLVTMYVCFEMLTLVTIPLVVHYGDHESNYAGRKYAAYTIGGASLAFFAVILTSMYGNGGVFVYGGSLTGDFSPHLMRVAFLLGFFGFGTKAAVFPLYDWLPQASVAPTPVTALLHAVAVVNSGAFAVMRMTWYVFGPEVMKGTRTHIFCLMISAFSLLFAAVMAVKERHFKRKLAFSTASNLSYMLLGTMLMTQGGFVGGMAHLLFHGVIKMALFLCAGAFMHMSGREYVYELEGAGRRMPVTFACYTIGALSLIGIPPLCGFFSKWELLAGCAEEGSVWGLIGAGSLIVSAFLCAVYTLTVSARAYFPSEGKDRFAKEGSLKEAGPRMLIPIVLFTAADLALGLMPGPVLSFLRQIAGGIL